MRSEISRMRRLRNLITEGVVAMPGVPNASMARQVERAGFEAVYVSGAGLANCTAGLPDVGLLTLNEVATLAGFIARAVRIPAMIIRVPAAGSHPKVKVVDETGLPLALSTCSPGQAKATVHDSFARALLIGPRLATENNKITIKYGA